MTESTSTTPTTAGNGDRLTALAITCSLKPSPADSSTDLLTRQLLDALERHGVDGELVRAVDHDIRPGVEADMGDGDGWPALREKMLAADILVIGTPTWMGQHSSIAQRVLERLDAELSDTNEAGQPRTYGKVAGAVVVGNEDGAHHISAVIFQCLNDVGFTIPAGGVTYWNGEAMHATDYQDLDETPEKTASTTATLAANAAHLARRLRDAAYPAA
ncbi:NAD(P)H-dependent oxidoreductase [Pedococcus aerophilus]|uniref:NAD(P)H-dependent oxidoreductase n=1 Tax=Pedococcus aerophilus TaxID=436356 RepID=A0ABN3UHS6_9MICO